MEISKTAFYCADKNLKTGFIEGWKEILKNLLRSRELIWRLFLRDFSAKYRQSLLGVAWAVLNPAIIVAIFVFLNRAGVFNIEDVKVPYPLFALIGVSIYGIFSSGLSLCTNSIVGAGSMVAKINFPKISLVISSFGQVLVEFAVRLMLVAIIFFIFAIIPSWKVILFFPALVPVMLLTLGLGIFLSLLTTLFRDIAHAVSLFTTFFLFLTPVLYSPPESVVFTLLNQWNPLSHLIVGCRDLILLGYMSNFSGFLWSSFFSIIVFLLALRVFYLAEAKIAERV